MMMAMIGDQMKTLRETAFDYRMIATRRIKFSNWMRYVGNRQDSSKHVYRAKDAGWHHYARLIETVNWNKRRK
jgi:frataxin-like iron-binding protein CyaY